MTGGEIEEKVYEPAKNLSDIKAGKEKIEPVKFEKPVEIKEQVIIKEEPVVKNKKKPVLKARPAKKSKIKKEKLKPADDKKKNNPKGTPPISVIPVPRVPFPAIPVLEQKRLDVVETGPKGYPNLAKKTIRRSGLEIKEAEELQEKKRIAQEKEWEIPAFLRKVKFKS